MFEMLARDYPDLCCPDAAVKIQTLCGIYSRRYATRLAIKGMDCDDLEEEIVWRMLETYTKGHRPSGRELVRNARRDIFNILEVRQKDGAWNAYPSHGVY
jgi:hypothetical protein